MTTINTLARRSIRLARVYDNRPFPVHLNVEPGQELEVEIGFHEVVSGAYLAVLTDHATYRYEAECSADDIEDTEP